MPGSFGLRNSEFPNQTCPSPRRGRTPLADAGRPVVRSGCFSADVSGGGAGASCAQADPGPIATANSMRSGKTDLLGVHFMAAMLSALRIQSATPSASRGGAEDGRERHGAEAR